MCTQAFSRAVLATVSSLLLTAVNIWPACPKAVAEHARLATYDAADGQTYFALGLTAGLNKNLPGSHDVVVLFDTSASQMGAYREDALSALDSLLSTLPATDRVRLFAVDLEAVPMHDQFAACHSDAVAAARQQLEARAPLGATDLPRVVLRSLRDFANDRNVPRHLIYIGDGLSRANLLQGDELAELVATLASQRVSVSSYAVGSHCDISLLSALANHTGGNVVVDGERVSGQQAGTALAGIVHGEVLWPAAAKLPSEFAETYPLQFPPLRADRDSILIGRLEARATGAVAVESVVGEAVRKLQWQINPESSAVEFAFLPRLVEIARRDQGVSLPTFSSAALQEMRRFLLASADGISELGSRALASGDIESAKVLAEAALANDPGNEKAEVIQHAIQHRGDGVPEHQMQFRRAPEGLRVAQQPQPEASPAAPSLRAPTPPPAGTDAPLRLRGQDVGAFGDAPPEFGQQNGEFLDDVIARRRARDGVIRAEVRNGIADARDLLGSDPSAAVSELKLLLENARNAPDISGDLRAQLIDQIQSAIREGSRRTLVKTLRDAELAASRAQALDRLQIAKALQRRESRLSEILSRFDALMDEQRYDLAFDAALEAELLEPELPMTEVAVVSSALTREVATSTRLRKLRRRGFLDTFETVEQSLIPFPDEPPLVYPPREEWEALSARREKYATIDLATTGGAEERIFRALDKTADVDFLETALSDAVEILKDEYDIPIIIDEAALDIAGLDSSEPISLSLSGISLRSVLRLMLKAVDLTYVVQDEVLQITTIEEAEEQLVTKVYPVGDLVLPISSGLGFGLGGAGGIGGVGGGALGGAMNGGGMGGGFGGGMGGMGGMGGGMGGFGGGMGGGMFAVDDPVTLGEKNAPSVTPVASPRLQPRLPQVIRPDRTDKTPTAAWHEFFGSQRRAAPADQVRDADVRETVRQTMKSGQYAEVAALIQAALGHGFSQPWMYEALGLAMQAVEAPPAEIERALMSAIDITSSPDEIFFVAQYMSHIGLETRALSLFQQLAELNPARPEPYAAALKVALRLDDPAAVRWATVGVLKQAWAQDQREIEDHARRIAASALAELELEGRAAEAQEMRAELNQALARDCVARVSWTGDADVDILVSEPAGTVCSLRNPRTSSGGVMLGDASAATADESVQGMTETYVCSEAFPGKYRLLIRPVWGDVSAGKVTVEVATHYGTDRQQSIKRQIPLGENPAIVEFELGDGRRDEAIAEHQLGNAVQKQIEVGRAILAQQLNTLSSSEVAEELALNRFRNQALGGRLPLRLRGAVGFRPVITPLPEGTQFGATAVISANRKYVRISPQPVFSGVTSVATFNFVTGEEGGDGTNGGTGGNGGTGTGTGTGTGF